MKESFNKWKKKMLNYKNELASYMIRYSSLFFIEIFVEVDDCTKKIFNVEVCSSSNNNDDNNNKYDNHKTFSKDNIRFY